MAKVIEIEYLTRGNAYFKISGENQIIEIPAAAKRVFEVSVNQGIQGPQGPGFDENATLDGGLIF